jgi:hypothetical protein
MAKSPADVIASKTEKKHTVSDKTKARSHFFQQRHSTAKNTGLAAYNENAARDTHSTFQDEEKMRAW